MDVSLEAVIGRHVLGYVGKPPEPKITFYPLYGSNAGNVGTEITATPAAYRVVTVESIVCCKTEEEALEKKAQGYNLYERQPRDTYVCSMRKTKAEVWPRNAATEAMVRALLDIWLAHALGGHFDLECGPLKLERLYVSKLHYEEEGEDAETEAEMLRQGTALPANFKRLQELHAEDRARSLHAAGTLVRMFLAAPAHY
jgi:hypothetical protein